MADYQFGNKLMAMRQACGYSQFQMGRLVGVTDKAVSKWENGQSKPRLSVCKKLASIFGVSLDALLGGGDATPVTDIEKRKAELWQGARDRLYEKFGPKPHPAFLARFESERIAMEASDAIFHMSAMAAVMRGTRGAEPGLFTGVVGGGSFVEWLLGTAAVNPLPPYTHCPHCHFAEIHRKARDGWDLPPQNCPRCGQPMERDGHGVPFAEFAYRVNHETARKHAISVPADFLLKCGPILEEAYEGLYRVVPYDTAFRGSRLNPEHHFVQDYLLFPLSEPIPELAEDGYLILDLWRGQGDDPKDLTKRYHTIEIFDHEPLGQEEILRACRENHLMPSREDLQNPTLWQDYWKAQREKNPINRVIMYSHEDLKLGFCIISEKEPHQVEWNTIADLQGDDPVYFSTLLQALTLFAKGDWENRFTEEIQSGRFTLADIPLEPEDVYKRLMTLITPDACVGMDFILKIMLDMRQRKYLEQGMDEDTRNMLRMLGVEEWYMDWMEKLNPFREDGEGIIIQMMNQLTILWLRQHGVEMNDGCMLPAVMSDRSSIDVDFVSDEGKRELLAGFEEGKKTKSPEEILADFMKYVMSDTDEPFDEYMKRME